jgi:hypothetical protein
MKYLAVLCILIGIYGGTLLGRWEERKAQAASPQVISSLSVFGCSTYEGTVFILKDGSQVAFDPTEKSASELAPAIEALAEKDHAGVIHTPCAADDPDVPNQNKTARF